MTDRSLVSEFLKDKQIVAVLSSPFKRAVDTLSDFSNNAGLTIVTVEDFRELKIDVTSIRNWEELFKNKWEDFSYKLSDSESISEV